MAKKTNNKKVLLEMQGRKYIFNDIEHVADYLNLNIDLLQKIIDKKLTIPAIKLSHINYNNLDNDEIIKMAQNNGEYIIVSEHW